jgi:hypothetical protein
MHTYSLVTQKGEKGISEKGKERKENEKES